MILGTFLAHEIYCAKRTGTPTRINTSYRNYFSGALVLLRHSIFTKNKLKLIVRLDNRNTKANKIYHYITYVVTRINFNHVDSWIIDMVVYCSAFLSLTFTSTMINKIFLTSFTVTRHNNNDNSCDVILIEKITVVLKRHSNHTWTAR